MSQPTEAEFLAQFDPQYPVQKVAKEVYRERYPSGMHHNGPMLVTLPVEFVQFLLSRWKRDQK